MNGSKNILFYIIINELFIFKNYLLIVMSYNLKNIPIFLKIKVY